MPFKQALEYGACVRKGELSTQIVFANRVTKNETNESGENVGRNVSFLKSYSVLNAQQIDGLPARFAVPAPSAASVIELPPRDAFFSAEAHFSTRTYATCHWTKAESRLARDFGAAPFRDEGT